MTKSDFKSLDKIQQTIKDCTKKPELFLSVQEQISQDLKNSTKRLYDLAVKTKRLTNTKSAALAELVVEGFDSEQIWQQLELENNEELGRLSLGKISKALASKKSWTLPLRLTKENSPQQSEQSDDSDDDEEQELSDKSNDELVDEENESHTETITKKIKKKRRITEVDDKFFKLDELNEFLKTEDKKASKQNKANESSDDDDEESIDLFNDIPDSTDDEDEIEDETEKSVKYADFFDNPDSDEECEKGNKKMEYEDDEGDDDKAEKSEDENDKYIKAQLQAMKDKKHVKFNILEKPDESNSDEDVEMKDEEGDNKEDRNNDGLSTFEKRQERLKEKIKKLESEAVSDKPWQLKGETSASTRPQNSLIEEYVEFDSVTRPAPVMTQETTMKLEDIIRMRIKDKAWDSVVKKFKPVETPMEYKKKLIMNQEKSKESLAQIYENEYVKQREDLTADDKDEAEKEEPPEHIEIKEKMHSLFRMLDALSNYHYTPKLAKPEIKIVSNLPAIDMEEVAPVATSDATLLAPEEVKAKQKGDVIGQSERTKTDMKRERRKKKLKQHLRAVHQSKKEMETVKPKKSLKNKAPAEKIKGRNIINDDEQTNGKDGRSIKSSTAFFAKLQDQVENQVKAKTSTSTSKKNKNTLSAVKLKL